MHMNSCRLVACIKCWIDFHCCLSPGSTLVAGTAAQQDMSPPRKRSKGAADPVADSAGPGGLHKPRFMPDGGRAGKVTGAELAAELQAKKRKDAKQFAALGQQLTGHGAETVGMLLCHCSLHLLLGDAAQTQDNSLLQQLALIAASRYSNCCQ